MAEEVGAAYVSLIPSARGFSKLAQRELDAELRGNRTPKIRVTPEIDADTARAQLTAQLTGAGQRISLPVDVDQQTASALFRQLAGLGGESGRAFGDSFTRDASGRLRDSRGRFVAAGQEAGRDVDRGLRASLNETDRGLLRNLGNAGDTDRRGRVLGNLFGRALGGGIDSAKGSITAALTAPFRDPKLALILVAALVSPLGAALVPALGAAISAALIGAAGLGVIGLGAFLLKDDPQVRKAAGDLGKTAAGAFTAAAQPLVQPFVASLNILRDLVNELRPELAEMFTAIAPAIVPLTRGLAGFIREAMPGLLALVKAATPFLMDLEHTLPRLGDHLSRFFGAISAGGPGATQFFRDFLHVLGLGLVFFGSLIRVLTGWYAHTRTVVKGVAAVWLFFQSLTGRVVLAVIGFFGRLGRFVNGVWTSARAEGGRFLRWLQGLPGWVKAAIGGLGTLLINSGKDLIAGLIRGIRSKIGDLAGVMGDVAQKVRDYWPFSPAKTGPLSGRGSLFYAGQNLSTDLASGMERRLPVVESASAQLAGAVGFGTRGGDGAALAPAGITAGWRPDATGDQLLDAIRGLIEFRYGGDPVMALGSR